jgi:hypothetical protein
MEKNAAVFGVDVESYAFRSAILLEPSPRTTLEGGALVTVPEGIMKSP